MAGQVISKITAGGGTHLISQTFYGTCATAAATAAKEVIVNDPTITNAITLVNGMTMAVKFTNANGVASPKITVYNNSGTAASPTKGSTTLIAEKAIMRYGTTAPSTNAASSWTAGAVVLFVYDGTNWVESSSWDNNTTYTNASLGQGYGTCGTAAATAAKVVTLSSYALTTGGIVAVKFTYAVPASATMNINSKGAKNIFYRGAAITAGIINAGDIATFIYDGTQYQLLSVDNMACSSEIVVSSTQPTTASAQLWITP